MFTRQPDFMIGNSYGKFIQRDTLAKGEAFEVPFQHGVHQRRDDVHRAFIAPGGLAVQMMAVEQRKDHDTSQLGKTDYSFDLVR
jgi:nitrogenase molybdenum-iron protein beta chain